MEDKLQTLRTLDVIPRQWFITKHVRERFSCRSCETITQAAGPLPCDCATAPKGEGLAPVHSIASSAMASIKSGLPHVGSKREPACFGRMSASAGYGHAAAQT